MIRHTLMWKFCDSLDGMDKDGIINLVEGKLYDLKPIIPEIISMKVERDILRSERSFDMLYIAEFESLEALERYRIHPEHVKVAEFIARARVAQAVCDSEI